MEKYTFIVEYQKGTYIQQVLSDNLEMAIQKWAGIIDTFGVPNLGNKEKEIIAKELTNESVTKLVGIDNVWCLFLKIHKSYFLVNIVATK